MMRQRTGTLEPWLNKYCTWREHIDTNGNYWSNRERGEDESIDPTTPTKFDTLNELQQDKENRGSSMLEKMGKQKTGKITR